MFCTAAMFGLLHSIIEITSAIDPAITENSLTKMGATPKNQEKMYVPLHLVASYFDTKVSA